MVGLAVILILFSILLLSQLGITGHTPLNAENSFVSHDDGLTLRVDPDTYTDRLRVRIESVSRLEFLEGSAGRALHEAAGDPKTIRWLSLGHVNLDSTEFHQQVLDPCMEWLQEIGFMTADEVFILPASTD